MKEVNEITSESDQLQEYNNTPSLQKRSGFVAVIGATNAGKSTLINRLVNAKVSIVTHKVQTTRSIVRGITIYNKVTQIVFIDTPGIFNPKNNIDQSMINAAWKTPKNADITFLIIDSKRGLQPDVYTILERICKTPYRKVLVLNKIDCIKPHILLEQAKTVNELSDFERTFMISASKGYGCQNILDYLGSSLPEGPWYYPEDQISDMPMAQFAAEITREKLFLRLHQEIPYSSHVVTEKWENRKDGSVFIRQVIYVERENQRKIALGKNGEIIKLISLESRKEISGIVKKPVHLFLFIKVQKNKNDH
ncbi:GTPase Era [Liberibacter crescens]|uniref:GTPase Era n=1 Tax=Liberibacter crescens TaxID=1273132 RepID=UPI0009E9EC73|nr:GTPase Era [Liberibacter crescens]